MTFLAVELMELSTRVAEEGTGAEAAELKMLVESARGADSMKAGVEEVTASMGASSGAVSARGMGSAGRTEFANGTESEPANQTELAN
jgi:hypothetical protein